VVAPPDIDGLPPAELKQLVLRLLEENAAQKRVIAELREAIARLKGLKGRPAIKPSGMENATSAKPSGKHPRRRGRGKIVPRVSVADQILKQRCLPAHVSKGMKISWCRTSSYGCGRSAIGANAGSPRMGER
jgi:hypothetical protein